MEARPENSFNNISYVYWKNQIHEAESWRKKFNDSGCKIIKRYREDDDTYTKTYNILYSNTETLLPVVFNDAPKAEVRAQDSSDVSARKSAELIEKAVNYYINTKDFNCIARMAVLDFLLPGMGQIRPRYRVIEDEINLEEENIEKKVAYEFIEYEYVHWKDFIYPECATWDDVPWIAFRAYMSYDEALEQFGSEKASQLVYAPYESETTHYYKKNKDAMQKAEVYEIWDKEKKQRIFFADSVKGSLIEIDDDPLELDGFYPVPEPLNAITTSGTLLPVPFFKLYQNQADQLDNVNERMYYMIDAMKRRGFFDNSIKELGNISNLGDNEFIAVDQWQDFIAKGGINGVMQPEDITSYANIITVLLNAKQELLNDIYQIIGLADIRRAQTDPRETLGAQRLKSRYGTIRISTYQRKVQQFMRNLIKITGEIIINQFDAETLALITNSPLTTEVVDGQVRQLGTIDLLKNMREKFPTNIDLDIQTDSTIIEDTEEQRAAMSDAINAMASFTQIAPGLTQSLGLEATSKIMQGIVQKFKLGRDIQQDVNDHLKQLENQQEQPSEPNIEQQKLQLEAQKTNAQLQLEQQKIQLNAQLEAAKLQVKQQENIIKAQELGIKDEVEREKINLEALEKIMLQQKLDIEARSPVNEVVGV